MNQEQLNGQFRSFLAALLGYYAAKYLPPDLVKLLPPDWTPFAAAFLAGLPSALWSWWNKRAPAIAKQATVILQDHPILATQVSNALAPAPSDAPKA